MEKGVCLFLLSWRPKVIRPNAFWLLCQGPLIYTYMSHLWTGPLSCDFARKSTFIKCAPITLVTPHKNIDCRIRNYKLFKKIFDFFVHSWQSDLFLIYFLFLSVWYFPPRPISKTTQEWTDQSDQCVTETLIGREQSIFRKSSEKDSTSHIFFVAKPNQSQIQTFPRNLCVLLKQN